MSHFPEKKKWGVVTTKFCSFYSIIYIYIYIYMLCAVYVIGLSCLVKNGEHSQHFLPFSNDRPFNVHSHFSPSITFRNHSGKDILKSDDRMTKMHCKTLNWEALCVEVRQVNSPECVYVCVLYLTNTGNKCPTNKQNFRLPHYIILKIKPCHYHFYIRHIPH